MKRFESPKKFEEIAVSIGPRRSRRSPFAPSTSGSRTREYDAVVYGHLPEIAGEISVRGYPEQIGGLPLAAVETIRIRWAEYEEYLSWFLESEKQPHVMRDRLLEPMSPGLERLIKGSFSGRPVRIWWHMASAELEELPWELLAQGDQRGRISFVRGLPGDVAPLMPIKGDLRLAVIAGDAGLDGLWNDPPAGLSVSRMRGGLRDGLRAACAREFDLIHIVAEGAVSLGFDSILRIGDDRIAPPELHALLTGARVAILAVSPMLDAQHDRSRARATFRAFAHLGGGDSSNTTLVAPVGPLSPGRQHDFWRELYATLARKLSIEDALWAANRECSEPTPVALFLRHRLGKEFSRRSRGAVESTSATNVDDPSRLDAELRASREFLDRLAQLQVAGERSIADGRQSVEQLDRQLDPWRDTDGGDE